MREAWIEIDLEALRHNITAIRDFLSPRSSIMGIIKANAYGHGAVRLAHVLETEGIQRFGVALLQEGVELRGNGITSPILILGHTPVEDFSEALEHDLTLTLYTLEQAVSLDKAAQKADKKARVHLKIDTGMGRIGFLPNSDSLKDIKAILSLQHLNVEGIFSHQAWADNPDGSYAQEQFNRFKRFLEFLKREGIQFEILHMANSATTINYPHMHLDLVRVGISLYGLYPDPWMARHPKIDLCPVMSVKAKLVHVKTVPKGTPISYGCTFRTKRKSLIGTVPIGYADGIPRILSNRGEVLARGKRCPIIGRICMDQFMIDLTDLNDCKTGEEIVFLGTQGKETITADEIAKRAGTVNYEIVTRMSPRLPRLYLDRDSHIS